MAYIIYFALCTLYGVASTTAGVGVKSWEYWIILGCIVGAFFCGQYA